MFEFERIVGAAVGSGDGCFVVGGVVEGACVEIVGDGVRGEAIVIASVPVDIATPDFVEE